MTATGPEDRVRRLLRRAVRAGLVVGAVARWGRGDDGDASVAVVEGRAAVRPAVRPATADTWFDLASLTKPLITTTLALLAVRSGALRLDSTVGEVLDETRGTAVGGLRLRSLLAHSAGLPAWLPLYCMVESADRSRLAARLAALPLAAPTDSRVVYSCVGFIIVGLMLERIAGAGLAELARSQVLRPLQLEDELGFNPDPGRRSLAGGAAWPRAELQLVQGLGLDASRIPPVGPGRPDDGNARLLGGAAGNSGLFGTALGVWRLAREYRRGGGTLLTAAEAALATAPAAQGRDQVRGLGWQLAATRGCSAGAALPPSAFGHTGFTGVSVWWEPSLDLGMVLLGNRVHPAHHGADLHPLRRRFHRFAGG